MMLPFTIDSSSKQDKAEDVSPTSKCGVKGASFTFC